MSEGVKLFLSEKWIVKIIKQIFTKWGREAPYYLLGMGEREHCLSVDIGALTH